ncbi:crotonase/enoyl-CoA hydratase family protein [Alcanivorax sp. JB21]|uniref:crotonase/enoyl-CoA hydratase family protein n=1 Tax=Alcanivorax limicola TaxID=2874102 RepID=UPI001CBFFC1E|nr:crotonase/enoyl-CoA hydratase family protein [Alcanivorax limicola]MBZ2187885.1 crotonase/enoyl-CoA hydratase family protein [Alcanivorax limicola]
MSAPRPQFETLLYEVADGILTLTLNRPDRLNAFTDVMAEELISAMDAADADDAVRVIIVTGAGRAFCAGADLGKGADTFNYDATGDAPRNEKDEPDWELVRDTGGRVTLRMFESIKPMIAAINGPAVGVGATMTLPMDIRIASRDARMGFVFCRRGIVPDGAASWLLPKVVGLPQSLEWVLSGRVFDAEEGQRGGLLRSLHEGDALMAEARRLAREIADNTSAVSVALSRQMLWRMAGEPHPQRAHEIESRAIYWTGRSDDAKEGVLSFIEKRPARFSLSPVRDMPPGYPWWD